MATFSCLVRFRDPEGSIHYADVPSSQDLVGKRTRTLNGSDPWNLKPTSIEAEIAEVLCPLPQVPIIYGIGLNYKKHIEEASLPVAEFPVVFTKPNDSLAGPYEAILINSKCLEMDYEGELVVVIGKDMRDFSKGGDPLDYVFGYTVGNDVSSRYWQRPERCGNQHGMAKSFDKFAPLGPVIISPNHPSLKGKLEDGLPNLTLRTKVNGELRQEANTDDLLFRLTPIFEYISLGRTIRKGTVIMTGTPSGVAAFMNPPQWLKSGDIVEIEIENIGTIRNEMVIA